MNLMIDISNGFRAWGASSLLLALPIILGFVATAFRGAVMCARFESMVDDAHRWEYLRVFFLALWNEGATTPYKVNLWVVVLMFVFLVGAGSGIFIAINFTNAGIFNPLLTIVLMVLWCVLSVAGWLFTVSTANNPKCMVWSAVVLLISFQGVALGLGR